MYSSRSGVQPATGASALQDLRGCVGSYCAGDPFDADCQTLKSSF